ncbi:MAG: Rrf2 family transcriptional regulator [Planctomycetes bacterium]|nr:Rrf2 family transcriptional regulator [Planctomycetota bacterium]
MQLTQFTDFALRLLIHLAITPGERVPLPRIAAAYGISQNHLVKTVQTLVAEGFVKSWRGRSGGLELARPAEEIIVGEVVRVTEPGLDLLGCFDDDADICVISPTCRLKGLLRTALASFVRELDAVTLADIVKPRRALAKLLGEEGS